MIIDIKKVNYTLIHQMVIENFVSGTVLSAMSLHDYNTGLAIVYLKVS